MKKARWLVVLVTLTAILSVAFVWNLQIFSADPATPSCGSFTVSGAISNDMVVQRDKPVRFWGSAAASENGKTISGTFRGETVAAVVKDGKWCLEFFAGSWTSVGQTLKIQSASMQKTYTGILVGDVYLIAGQSNAARPVKYTREDADASKNDLIRLYYQANYGVNMPGYGLLSLNTAEPQYDVGNANYRWSKPTDAKLFSTYGNYDGENAAEQFSAMGYFFLKKIVDNNGGIPVGGIMACVGGANLYNFMTPDVAAALGYTAANTGADGLSIASIYNAEIAPFTNMAIRGMVFYQGEVEAIGNANDTDSATSLWLGKTSEV